VKRKQTRAYLDSFGVVKSVLELDALTVREIVEQLDPEREDPLLNPWRRFHHVAIRTAWGH
jgi:hypothetical protein